MRRFATEGPIRPEDHYHVPPLARLDLPEMLDMIQRKRYFVLHAPRQTGKTSALIALKDLLNHGEAGDFRCVHMNVEVGQAARDDTERAMRAILSLLATRARSLGDGFLDEVWPGILATSGPDDALRATLTSWCLANPTPLVLLVDEIDSLVGDTLLSVLRQLRAGYEQRPEEFPQSVVLCGVRDVHDYRIRSSSEAETIAGGSPFNVAAKSLRLGDFSQAEARALLAQHTEATGQAFTSEAVDTVWTQTQGQPWLVNALCADACFDHPPGRDRSRAITGADILNARERLILSRRTHLDQLAHKLGEARVRRVVEPILSGRDTPRYSMADLDYVRDLGLVARDPPPRIANPIYAEVVPRELGHVLADSLDQDVAWYVDADGGLNVDKLLAAFQVFFRMHSEHWLERFEYRETGPQLLLQAFLHQVVNGGGRIEREFGLGRGRTDLLISWPAGEDAPPERWRKFVVECKVLHEAQHRTLGATIAQGVAQTAGYMDRCGSGAGHLIVFDRTKGKPWEERVFRQERRHDGRTIVVWGM